MLQLVRHFWALSVQEVYKESPREWQMPGDLEGLFALRREHEVYFERYLALEEDPQGPLEPLEESPASVYRRLRSTEEDVPSGPTEEDLRLLRVKKLMNCLWVPEDNSRPHWEDGDSQELVSLLAKIDNLEKGRPVALTIFIHCPQRPVDERFATFMLENLRATYPTAPWTMAATTELGGVSAWTFETSNLSIKIRSLRYLSVFSLLSLHFVAWLGEPGDDLEKVLTWQREKSNPLSIFNTETRTWETPSSIQ